MHDPGNRTVGAIANVGRRPPNCTGCSEPPEQRCNHVRNALSDEFLIRIVVGIRHAIRHRRRQQRFNRSKKRDGKGGSDELDQHPEVYIRKPQMRQRHGYAAEFRSEGGYALKNKLPLQSSGEQHRHE